MCKKKLPAFQRLFFPPYNINNVHTVFFISNIRSFLMKGLKSLHLNNIILKNFKLNQKVDMLTLLIHPPS